MRKVKLLFWTLLTLCAAVSARDCIVEFWSADAGLSVTAAILFILVGLFCMGNVMTHLMSSEDV